MRRQAGRREWGCRGRVLGRQGREGQGGLTEWPWTEKACEALSDPQVGLTLLTGP